MLCMWNLRIWCSMIQLHQSEWRLNNVPHRWNDRGSSNGTSSVYVQCLVLFVLICGALLISILGSISLNYVTLQPRGGSEKAAPLLGSRDYTILKMLTVGQRSEREKWKTTNQSVTELFSVDNGMYSYFWFCWWCHKSPFSSICDG